MQQPWASNRSFGMHCCGRLGRLLAMVFGLVFVVNLAPGVSAGGWGPAERATQDRRFFDDLPASEPMSEPAGISPILPPLKEPEGAARLPVMRIFVNQVVITGVTVFSDDELKPVIRPFEGRKLNSEDLETLRRNLTQLYISSGFINSGAIIPDQEVREGVLRLHVIEGALSHIAIGGNRWFRSNYIAARLKLDSRPPLNVYDLENRLRLLQQDTRIERFEAELQPGLRPGQSVLNVQLEERYPVHLRLAFNNYQSPSVGAERGQIFLENHNITGHGDILQFSLARSQGVDPQLTAAYTLPLSARDTRLILEYRKNDFYVVEEQFRDLDVQSKSNIYGLTLKHPFYKTLRDELAMHLTLERLTSETFILGQRLSFTNGDGDGRSRVLALRFGQEYTHRSGNQMLGLRARLSVGLDADNATHHTDPERPDGRFVSWLGQVQWARRLPWSNSQILFRTDLQLANNPLLPLEQISVGGRYSVRGYPENLMVRDNALISSLEYRQPLLQQHTWADTLWLVPFVDYGRAWRTRGTTPAPDSIGSVGLGLIWELTLGRTYQVRPQIELFWGYALRRIDSRAYNLQNDGIHFQVSVAGF